MSRRLPTCYWSITTRTLYFDNVVVMLFAFLVFIIKCKENERERRNFAPTDCSLVEFKVKVGFFDMSFVALFKVFLKDDISVFSDSMQASFLANRVYVGATELVWPSYKVLQIDLAGKVHFGGDCLKDEPLLSTIRIWKFDFPVKTTRAQESRVQRVGPVCCHDDLCEDV